MNKIIFVTNFAPHYRVGAFEEFANGNNIKYYFFSDFEEEYWEKKNPIIEGIYNSKTFKGFYILPKFKISLSLIFALCTEKFDLIIKCINGRLILPIVFLISKVRQKKFILWQTIWYHPKTFFHRISYPILKLIWRMSDAIVVYGDHVKSFLISQGVNPDKIFIAFQAVDNSIFNIPVSNEAKYRLLDSLDIQGKKVILFVGRLSAVKGLEYLIEAFKQIDRDDTVLIIIGEGFLESKLKEQALSSDIKFLGYISQDRLPVYYSIASVFILPSISLPSAKEAWGLVINEAMNQGCPVVATNAVGAAMGGLLRNNINGIIVPEKSVEELRNAINRILDDEYLAKEMSKNSKETVAEFNFKNWANGFNRAISYCYKKK